MICCDHCGREPAPVVVDSVVGLAAWNRVYPDDQRTVLHFCSEGCTFLSGWTLGALDFP
jgi:hypothetical protein